MNVVDEMGRQIRATALPVRTSHRWRGLGLRSALAAGVGAVAAAVATVALLLALSASSPPPAYAVTLHGAHKVTVSLRSLSSLGALNRRMEALNLPIRAVPVVRGCHAKASMAGRSHEPTTLTVNPKDGRLVSLTVILPTAPGRTLVLGAARGGFYSFGEEIQGAVPDCIGIDSLPFLIFAHH